MELRHLFNILGFRKTIKEVLDTISKLKCGKKVELNGIPNEVLKSGASILIPLFKTKSSIF